MFVSLFPGLFYIEKCTNIQIYTCMLYMKCFLCIAFVVYLLLFETWTHPNPIFQFHPVAMTTGLAFNQIFTLTDDIDTR